MPSPRHALPGNRLQGSAAAFQLQLESGAKLQCHLYLCYDHQPAQAAAAAGCAWQHSCKPAPSTDGCSW